MAARPTDTGSFAEAVYAQMAPVVAQDQTYGWAFLLFLGGLGQMFQQLDTLAHGDGADLQWTALLDIDQIPDEGLPWFGQFVGVSVNPSYTPDQQRQQIRAEGGMARGTLSSMVSAIQKLLINQQIVIVRERFNSAYNFEVITYAGDTYVSNFDYEAMFDQEANYTATYNGFNTYSDIYALGMGASLDVYNAILRNKPAGLTFTYEVLAGQDYYLVWQNYISYQAVYAHYATYLDLLNDAPAPAPFTFETVISNPDYLTVFNDFQEYQDVYANDLTY